MRNMLRINVWQHNKVHMWIEKSESLFKQIKWVGDSLLIFMTMLLDNYLVIS